MRSASPPRAHSPWQPPANRCFRETRLPGAVLTRVAASHLRVGTFQFFAARQDIDRLRQLADYAIARHDPDLTDRDDRYLALLRAVTRRQALLIAQWMNVGFIHGVMNTDNMTISGETIDYGPCAFMEAYDPATVFSSIDHGGRYAYRNQPGIAQWNLARLAETLLPLIAVDPDSEESIKKAIEQATAVLGEFEPVHDAAMRALQRAKLGLADDGSEQLADISEGSEDEPATRRWPTTGWRCCNRHSVDFTLGWRHLADAAEDAEAPRLRALFGESGTAASSTPGWRAGANVWRASTKVPSTKPVPTAPRACARSIRPSSRATTVSKRRWPRPRPATWRRSSSCSPRCGGRTTTMRALARYAEPAPASVTACYQTFCGT